MTWRDSGPGFDARQPNAARIYDYLIGGKDNFAADRQAAARLLDVLPHVARASRDNRAFLQRAVRFLASAGIRQFIDIGNGLPTTADVHQVAREADPGVRVAYVDYDPLVLVHARALLAHSPAVTVIDGDLRKPGDILAHEGLRTLIDFRQPVAVLLVAVLHFVADDEHPHEIVRTLKDAMAPGSYLAVSHVTADHVSAQASAAAQGVYADTSAAVTPRTRAEVTRFFDGLELIEPGVVDIACWHPEILPARPAGGRPSPTYLYGGMALKGRQP